jgi:hypothetical protein
MDFDFYSLSGRDSANARCSAGQLPALILHTIAPFVAIPKQFKQPSGLGEHLLFWEWGARF